MSKSSITIIASEETFQNLSTFTTIDELNKTVRYYKEKFADKITKSTASVLDQLHRYSCKYLGLSFRTKNNIAEALNISRKTVQRACKALEDLGIIKQLEMKRKSDMRQTSNAIQILRFVQQDELKMSSQEHNISLKQDHKKRNTLRTQFVKSSNQSSNKSTNQPIKEPINLVPNWVDLNFARISNYYFQSPDIIELYRIAQIHGRMAKLPSVTVSEVAIEALRATVYKIKHSKVSSLRGYFDGVCKRLFKRERVNDLFLSYFESQI